MWLAVTVYLFYWWIRVTRPMLKALEQLSTASQDVLTSGGKLSNSASHVLHTAAHVLEEWSEQARLSAAIMQDNPLMDDEWQNKVKVE